MQKTDLPILVIDDNEDHLEFSSRTLDTFFSKPIVSFTSPEEAYEWAETNEALLCLIDFRMPGLSGLDLTKKLRRLTSYEDTPIILVTADVSREMIPEIFDAGCNDYVTKPINARELFARVDSALRLRESLLLLRDENGKLSERIDDAKSQIEDREMRFRLAVDATETGIWDLDINKEEIYFSHKWLQILGYQVDDEIPHTLDFWNNRIVEDDLYIFETALNRVCTGKTDVIDCTFRMLHRNNHEIWVNVKGKLYSDVRHNPWRIVGAIYDITEMQETYEELSHSALHDKLTGLPNRALFEERLERAFMRYKRNPKSIFTLMFIDVDNFKYINDTYGHSTGDRFLMYVAEALKVSTRDVDTIARFGGDEFVILLDRMNNPDSITACTERLCNFLNTPLTIAGQDIRVTLSIGAVTVTSDYENVTQITKDADVALYQAKENGRDQLVIFDQSLKHLDPRKKILLETLSSALDNKEMEIFYQPLVDIQTGQTKGFESLLRWHHPSMGLISPVDFIPLAERTQMIVNLGNFVMSGALKQLSEWQQESNNKDLIMCINVSHDQISLPTFLESLKADCAQYNLNHECVVLEFSEYCLSQVFKWDNMILNELRDAGFNIALDDYGESRASIRSLVDFKINMLKVDRSLTLEVLHDDRKRKLFDLMIHLGHETDLKVVVEGIQTIPILDYVKKTKTTLGQGFLYSKPVPADEAAVFLNQNAYTVQKEAG